MAVISSRVRVYNGQYLVAVRYLGQWNFLQDFVEPDNPDVLAIFSRYGPDYWALYDFVCRNINYRRDIGEFWLVPSETLRGHGDCEDTAILLTSLIRAGGAPNCYVALGSLGELGHAWCLYNGQILETTYTYARQTAPRDYRLMALFNDIEVLELYPNSLAEVFDLSRDEATKLNLLATALGGGSANPGYRYDELPSMCVCHECGYTVANPGVHCPQLGECPICHAPRLWRA